jgi:hypothetical protein
MRGLGAVLLAAALTASFAGAAGGRSSARISLKLHATVRLAGTNVACNSGRASGVTYVDCAIVDAAGDAKKGSYLALLGQNGKFDIVTRASKIVFSKVGGSMMRESETGLVAHAGDTIALPGINSIFCSAANVAGKPTIFCDRIDAKGRFPAGSYAFGFSDSIVTALRWDSKGHAKLVRSWPENG